MLKDGLGGKEGYVLPSPRLLKKPTPELARLDRVVRDFYPGGIFAFRGKICQFFPDNAVGAGLVFQLFEKIRVKNFDGLRNDGIVSNELIDNLASAGYSPEQMSLTIPEMYKNALMPLNNVPIVRYNKESGSYLPVIIDGAQLSLDDVVVRQGFAEPYAIVVKGPYAGLLLSIPVNSTSSNNGGYSPKSITQLCMERILNDGQFGSLPWRSNYYTTKVAGINYRGVIDSGVYSDNGTRARTLIALDGIILNLPELIAGYYEKRIVEAKNDEKLSSVAQMEAVFSESGIPYSSDDVNYLLPSE